MLALIWGYSWVAMKTGIEDSAPFIFAAVRALPGGILLLFLAALLGHPVRPQAPLYTALVGLLQTAGFLGLTQAALVTGGVGRTAILANTWQFWILLFAWPILGERVRGLQWLAVTLALGGLVLIIEPWSLHGVVPSLLALGGALSFAAGSIVVKLMRRGRELSLIPLTGWQSLFGSVPLLVVAFAWERATIDWSPSFVLSYAWALVMTTCVASFLWLYVLRELPAGIAGLGTLGTPVVGVLSSWAQLAEQPVVTEVVGMVGILAGLGLLLTVGSSTGARQVTTQPRAAAPKAAAAAPRAVAPSEAAAATDPPAVVWPPSSTGYFGKGTGKGASEGVRTGRREEMNAYDIMHEWDRAAGNPVRTDQELDESVPALLAGEDYEAWKAALVAKDKRAIVKGLKAWGLPVGPLGPFEVEDAIETAERGD
jgi:drug/metabolite transporter (DMT)-like permease